MKKFSFLLISLFLSTTAIAQTKLPFIARDKDKSGKYGFVEKDKEIIPHIFDDARSFYVNEPMTYVEFNKEHFVIDRKGIMVGGEYQRHPEIFPNFAIVDQSYESGLNYNAGVVIDCNGKRILPNYYAQALNVAVTNNISYHLFAVSKDRKEYNFQLANIKGEIISKNLRGKFSPTTYGNILYIDSSPQHKEGIINAWGEVLIPCKYDWLDFLTLDKFYGKQKKSLQKVGVLDKYTTEQQNRVGIILAHDGNYTTIYDQSGTILVSPVAYKKNYSMDIIKKTFKKVIIPHFLRKGAVIHSVQEKINNPNVSRREEYLETVNKLPRFSSNKTSIVSYIKKLEQNPKIEKFSISECYNKGVAYHNQQKYTEAIPWLLRAAEGKYRPAYRKLADCYNITNQPNKAWIWYGSCVGGDGFDPNSNDYWYACMMLGNMFKAGRGCDKNYDSALHFLREFQKYTTSTNKATASEMIAEVLALKNKSNQQISQSSASNTNNSARSQSASNTNNASNANNAIIESLSRYSDVGRPSYGTIPTNVDIYMKNADKNSIIVKKFKFIAHNGDYILHVNNGGPGSMYKMTQNNSDRFVFQSCQQVLSSNIGTFNSLNVSYKVVMGGSITIKKDWSEVIDSTFESFFGKKSLTSMATKEEYDLFSKAASNIAQQFQIMSGDSGGDSVAPAQIKSGMSEAYYQDLYRKYERLAESAYRSLTSTGVSFKDSEGNREGSTLGSWQGSNYVGMKTELGKAQREMRRIRSEAAREGYNIMQSTWENATVSY